MINCFIKKLEKGRSPIGTDFVYANCIYNGEERHMIFDNLKGNTYFECSKDNHLKFHSGKMGFKNELEIQEYISKTEFDVPDSFMDIIIMSSIYETAKNTVDHIDTLEGKILNMLQYALYINFDEVKEKFEGKDMDEVKFDGLINISDIKKIEEEAKKN